MEENRKRAIKGEGSIRKKSNGKFEYRVSYKDIYGNRRRKSFTGNTEKECYERCDEFFDRLIKEVKNIDTTVTIVSILEEKYTKDYELNYIEASTYRRNMASLVHLKKCGVGYMPIEDVTRKHIDLYLKTLTRFANSNIQKYFQQLKLAFSIAKEREIIEKNIMLQSDIRRPRSKKADKKVRGYTIEEQKRLVNAINNHKVPFGRNDYRNQLLLELYTGMRMGEINALTEEDIDFEKGFIHISKTVARDLNDKAYVKNGAKTEAGDRYIPISKNAEIILKDAISKKPKMGGGLIFYDTYKDEVISTAQVNCFFHRICEKAGVHVAGQHALRHTFVSRCVESGIEPVVLKNWMGHTDIHITLDIYADVFDNMNTDAMKKLDEYLTDNDTIEDDETCEVGDNIIG